MNNIQSFVRERFGRERPTLPESVYKESLKIPKIRFGRILRNEQQPTIDELQRVGEWLGVDPKHLINF